MELAGITFNGDTLYILRKGSGNYVALKPLCELFGISYRHQVRRISNNRLYDGGIIEIQAPWGKQGALEKTAFLDLELLQPWLMELEVQPELRPLLEKYRREAAREIREQSGNVLAVLEAKITALEMEERHLKSKLKELEAEEALLQEKLEDTVRKREECARLLEQLKKKSIKPFRIRKVVKAAPQNNITLTGRDREIINTVYRLKTMTVAQINKRFFPESKWYCYSRMKELERAGYLVSRPLVESGRKISTCYYLGYRGATEIGVRHEPRWPQETWKQQHRVAVAEAFLQAEAAGWEWRNSREAKKRYRMNRGSWLEGTLVMDGVEYGFYLLDGEMNGEQIKSIQKEIHNRTDFDLNRFIVLHRRDEWADVFNDTCGAREFLVMPYGAGLEVIKALPRLDELLQEVLGGHGVKECNRFFARYVGEKDGKEFYVTPLLGNDLVMKYYLRRYTLEEAKRDGREVAVIKLEGQDLGIDPGVYPHVRVVEVPLSVLRNFLDRQAGDQG